MLTAVAAVVGSAAVIALARAAGRVGTADRARRLGARARWRVPTRWRPRLERALADAALDVGPESACELWLGGVLAVLVLAVAVAPGLAVPAVVVAIVSGPVGLRVARGRAQRRYVESLPGALEQVASALRGGTTVGEALDAAADAEGPLAGDLRRVRARVALGLGVAEALATWPAERKLGSVRVVAGALAVAASVGGASAAALDGLALSLRERLGAVAEARALAAQARLSAVVVGAAPIGYLAFSAIVDSTSVEVLVGTGLGRVCLALGLVLEATAVLWMRRIVRTDDES